MENQLLVWDQHGSRSKMQEFFPEENEIEEADEEMHMGCMMLQSEEPWTFHRDWKVITKTKDNTIFLRAPLKEMLCCRCRFAVERIDFGKEHMYILPCHREFFLRITLPMDWEAEKKWTPSSSDILQHPDCEQYSLPQINKQVLQFALHAIVKDQYLPCYQKDQLEQQFHVFLFDFKNQLLIPTNGIINSQHPVWKLASNGEILAYAKDNNSICLVI